MKTLPLENKRTNTVSFFVPSEWLWYGCGGGGGSLSFQVWSCMLSGCSAECLDSWGWRLQLKGQKST